MESICGAEEGEGTTRAVGEGGGSAEGIAVGEREREKGKRKRGGKEEIQGKFSGHWECGEGIHHSVFLFRDERGGGVCLRWGAGLLKDSDILNPLCLTFSLHLESVVCYKDP